MQSKKYNCLIVDDEPIARKIIENYISKSDILQIAGQAKNAYEALDHLRKENHIDIVFLDINLPSLSGLSMIKVLQSNPQIVFTTAYSEYAVQSYELNATDYLLKPFSIERFTIAVFKCINNIEKRIINRSNAALINNETPFYIKSDGKNFPVLISNILFCEAMKNYTKVFLSNGKRLMPLIPLSKFEAELADLTDNFVKIHRSFIISKLHITAIKANTILVNEHELPIGSQYKEYFLKNIGMM